MIFLELFLTFAKIGFFTFGGGYAMISLIERECVDKRNWISHEDMMNIIVIAESTPGPVAINCATFVGKKQKGFLGAVVATLGMIVPSFIVIFLITLFLDSFLEITWIANAFKGIKIAVGILILDAGIRMARTMKVKKPFPIAILSCAGIAMLAIDIFALNFSSILIMIVAAAVGLIVYSAGRLSSGKGGSVK